MFLYKLEREVESEAGVIQAVVVADTDERAFESAEALLLRHFGKPVIPSASALVEKKRIEQGSGYVIV